MCLRRGVIEIDIAGDQDVVVAGPAANGCGCGICTCADNREKIGNGDRLERGYGLELMLMPLAFASLPDGWKRR